MRRIVLREAASFRFRLADRDGGLFMIDALLDDIKSIYEVSQPERVLFQLSSKEYRGERHVLRTAEVMLKCPEALEGSN